VKFSQTIEIPGVGQKFLPAGTYVFKLVDSLSNRDIVQIFNEDETHVFATILTIANYRLKATDETVMTFSSPWWNWHFSSGVQSLGRWE
jgi:hypothetical protein